MAIESGDEASPVRPLSAPVAVENHQSYLFAMQPQVQQFTFPHNNVVQGVGGGIHSPVDVSSFSSLCPGQLFRNQGMYGSMQGLLESFSIRKNEESNTVSYGFPMFSSMNPFNGYFSQASSSAQYATLPPVRPSKLDGGEGSGAREDAAIVSESPTRINVDDSGYESSCSSVYDVLSDDEEDNRRVVDDGADNDPVAIDDDNKDSCSMEAEPNEALRLLALVRRSRRKKQAQATSRATKPQ